MGDQQDGILLFTHFYLFINFLLNAELVDTE